MPVLHASDKRAGLETVVQDHCLAAEALFLLPDSPGFVTNSTAGWAAVAGDPLAIAVISAALGFVLGAITIYLAFLGRR